MLKGRFRILDRPNGSNHEPQHSGYSDQPSLPPSVGREMSTVLGLTTEAHIG